MTKQKEEQKQEEQEETREQIDTKELKEKYHYGVSVEIQKYNEKSGNGGLRIRVLPKSDIVDRVTFPILETENGERIDVTWKPRRTVNQTKKANGFIQDSTYGERYSIEEFKKEFPELYELSKISFKEDITIIMSYTEKEFYNEKEKEIETYYFMRDWQLKNLYIPNISSEEKLKWQNEKKNQTIPLK